MRKNFTLVLKGHIAIARAVFPDGTTGAQLDTLARQFLWRAGLDFDHGTGHGVGSYLSVHEGPARISKLGAAPLKRGMILSNEPGYYRTGAYGIRIENLVLVTEAAPVADAEKPLNAFETLTLAPIDRRLIEPAMMSAEEIALARRLSCARARRALRPRRCADAGMADRGDGAARAELNFSDVSKSIRACRSRRRLNTSSRHRCIAAIIGNRELPRNFYLTATFFIGLTKERGKVSCSRPF